MHAHSEFINDSRTISNFFFKFQSVAQLKSAKDELKKAKSLLQMTELKNRKRVLRRLGYCTAADVIELKGRVACELSR